MAVTMSFPEVDDPAERDSGLRAEIEKSIASPKVRRFERPAYVRSELYAEIKKARADDVQRRWDKRKLHRSNAAAVIREQEQLTDKKIYVTVSEAFNQQFKPKADLTEQWLEGEKLDERIREALREAIRRFMLAKPGRQPHGETQARLAKKILDERKIGSKKVRLRERIREIALEKEFKDFRRPIGKTYPK